jgi:hypothetical protein
MPKGQYDRATSNWRPYDRPEDPPELVERVRETYQAGHTMRETAEIVGTTVKVLQRLMPQHGIDRRPAIPRDQYGEANASWKGNEAGYKAMHLRVVTQRGQPSRCSACDNTVGRIEWANLTGHYEEITDYVRMCVPCHRKFDGRRRRLGR